MKLHWLLRWIDRQLAPAAAVDDALPEDSGNAALRLDARRAMLRKETVALYAWLRKNKACDVVSSAIVEAMSVVMPQQTNNQTRNAGSNISTAKLEECLSTLEGCDELEAALLPLKALKAKMIADAEVAAPRGARSAARLATVAAKNALATSASRTPAPRGSSARGSSARRSRSSSVGGSPESGVSQRSQRSEATVSARDNYAEDQPTRCMRLSKPSPAKVAPVRIAKKGVAWL